MIWLSVQVSQDGVPVLYRPTDLATLTNSTGAVSAHTAAQLAQIDAGWAFTSADGRHPYRGQAIGIPTVAQALQLIPTNVEVIFDVKTNAPRPAVPALMNAVTTAGAWSHVLFYSTQQDVHDAMSEYPKATVFEARDATRHRLLQLLLTGVCDPPTHSITWVGYEVFRPLSVTEEYTLGTGTTSLTAQMWTDETVSCTRRDSNVHILFFGVNSPTAFELAARLRPDAILTDSISQNVAALHAVGWPP